MVKDSYGMWKPLMSCGRKILFLTQEEGKTYLNNWINRQTMHYEGFVKAEIC